jgi:3',5'-cyclic AMP phosphodiesterase CpdA
MPDLFAAALDRIRGHNPDLLVISGDLIDYPMGEMAVATTQEQGRKDLELLASLLVDLPFALALVHGNHDHPALIDQVFGHLPNDQLVKGHRVLTFRDDEGPNHVPVRVGKEQARFRAALADSASPPQIHIQHYVVWPKRNQEYPHTYGAGAQMREEMIATGNVRLVLSGHYHIGVPLFLDKGVWFATVRGFTDAPHPYNIYEIKDGIKDNAVTEQTFTLAA